MTSKAAVVKPGEKQLGAGVAASANAPAKKTEKTSSIPKGPSALVRRHSSFVRLPGNSAEIAAAQQKIKAAAVSPADLSGSVSSPASNKTQVSKISPTISDAQRERLRTVSIAAIQKTAASSSSSPSSQPKSPNPLLNRFNVPLTPNKSSSAPATSPLSPVISADSSSSPALLEKTGQKNPLPSYQSPPPSQLVRSKSNGNMLSAASTPSASSVSSALSLDSGLSDRRASVDNTTPKKAMESAEEYFSTKMEEELRKKYDSFKDATPHDRLWAYLSYAREKSKEARALETNQKKQEAASVYKLVEASCNCGIAIIEALKLSKRDKEKPEYKLFASHPPEEDLAQQKRGLDALRFGAVLGSQAIGEATPVASAENKNNGTPGANTTRRKSLFARFMGKN